MLETCKAHGLVKARTKQRTDSTHVLAAIRTLNRLELVGETLRAALNSLATVAPQWLRAWVPPEWFDRYAARVEESRLPKGEEARYAHGEAIGADGFRLLDAVYGADAPRWLGDVPAVEVLRRVWLAQYYLDEGRVRWRKAGDLPPAGRRIDSPYDPEATFGNKRSTTWTGYKVHLTETCEDDEVHLITNVETTPAVAADVDQTAPIHTALAAKGLLPGDHLLDAGYVDAELLVGSRSEHGVRLVGPVRPDVSWQAQADRGLRHLPLRHRLGGAAGDLPGGQDERAVAAGPRSVGQRGDPHRVRATRVPGLRQSVAVHAGQDGGPRDDAAAAGAARGVAGGPPGAGDGGMEGGVREAGRDRGDDLGGGARLRPAPLPLRRAGEGASPTRDHGGGDESVAVGGLAGGGPAAKTRVSRFARLALAG